jgi:hypothetical protein
MAKDIYHQHVKEALVKDGWTVTHASLPLVVDDELWEIASTETVLRCWGKEVKQ